MKSVHLFQSSLTGVDRRKWNETVRQRAGASSGAASYPWHNANEMLIKQPSGVRPGRPIRGLTISAFWISVVLCILRIPASAAEAAPGICLGQHGGPAAAWVFADFDGDKKLDLAIVNAPAKNNPGELRRITIYALEPGAFPNCTASGSERLRVRDLDGDADRDLVLETLTAEPIAVWLNDGAGHFNQGKVADFHYQLSNFDPRSLDSVATPLAQQDTLEGPTTEIAARVTASSIYFIQSSAVGNLDGNRRAGFSFNIRSRGPPRQS
jgi:hypothetical protein